MVKSDYKIHIIGAGVSGLIAALTLEKFGYNPIIIEATDSVGGRVKTDIVDGYQLDHGFQVLLDAYPKAKEYLDYEALQLQRFLPGSVLFSRGKSQTIGDASRNLSLLWPTLLASAGSVSDKLKILKLNSKLQKTNIESIFKAPSMSTLEYLKAEGFSDKMIQTFFKPFFTGIFLEPDLKTSSRMFEFVYKMFGEGFATLPKSGIGAISEQLKSKLERTVFQFNTKVKSVNDNYIELENGQKLDTHFSIITAGASQLISNLKSQSVVWKSCYNLYFETETKAIQKPLIGLVTDEDALINNVFYHTSIETTSKGEKELLSVTVVKPHKLNEQQLINRVETDLKKYCNIGVIRHLKTYHIPKSLPDIDHLEYDISPTETQIKPTVFLAGDYLLNGSLNAAMLSGERAAQGLIMTLEDGLVVDNLTSEYI